MEKKKISFLSRAVMMLFVMLLTASTAWATITGTGTQADPYVLSTVDDWNTFASNVNNNTKDYSGEYVKLSDSWDNNGNPVTTWVGYNYVGTYRFFKGTFDGNGKTLWVNLSSSESYCAPFKCVDGATFKALHVAGTITSSYRFAAGLIGYSNGNVSIQNCRSSVAIQSSNNSYTQMGGFIGSASSGGDATISNCLFDGSITNTAANNIFNCGGLVGYFVHGSNDGGTMTIENCLMAGTMTINGSGSDKSATICALYGEDHDNPYLTLTNCYYRSATGLNCIQGTQTDATGSALQTLLGSGWTVSGSDVLPIADPYDLSLATVSGIDTYITYTGSNIALNYTVTSVGGTQLMASDYTVTSLTRNGTSTDAVKLNGQYTLTLTGQGSYHGTKTVTFYVHPDGLSTDRNFSYNDAGFFYVNMPTTGSTTVTLADADVTTFMVYDDGGKNERYTMTCDGTLVINAPDGYLLRVTGSGKGAWKHSFLSVYDGTDNTATQLFYTEEPNISLGTVTTTQKSMTINFNANDLNLDSYGFVLTVTLVNASNKHGITIANSIPTEGGTISSDKTEAEANELVTLTVSPATGYKLNGISVVDANSNVVSLTGGDYWYTNTTGQVTFNMPAAAVTVTPSFVAVGDLYIDMAKTGNLSATIPDGVTSFHVYDDGGAAGFHSYNCDGTLTLTAPAGYVLRLSGSIKFYTEVDKFYLEAFDGADNTADVLLPPVQGTYSDWSNIATVVSTGRQMTLHFVTEQYNQTDGLNLLVTLVDANMLYGITANNATGGTETGTIAADKSTAKVNETVTLTATPGNGYLLQNISVVDANSNAIDVTWSYFTNTATFKMPAAAVTVTPMFTNAKTAAAGIYANIPKTGTSTVNIPAGVSSLKVYDHGGATEGYDSFCNGYLTLTAPEGFHLTVSGNVKTLPDDEDDYLMVYDGTDNTGSVLVDKTYSTSTNTQPYIYPETSNGRSITLYFTSDANFNYTGVDLTVDVYADYYWVTFNRNNLNATGDMGIQKHYVNQSQALTANAFALDGYSFAGWATSTNGGVVYSDQEVVTNLTDTWHSIVNLYAVWAKNIELANAANNATVIADNNGKLTNVTLADRTLTKDGNWNTICLPFNVTAAQLAETTHPFYGATIMEMQNTTSLENGVLTLNFATATAIEAGKPYLIKWASGSDIVAPVFNGVTITSTTPTEVTSTDGKVTFVGQYNPFTIDSSNKDCILMLGSGNKIGYSKNDRTLKCFRAHFQINDVNAVREFNMNFGDETTNIQQVESGKLKVEGYYDLQGRKVAQPTKGLYIVNGKKVVVK